MDGGKPDKNAVLTLSPSVALSSQVEKNNENYVIFSLWLAIIIILCVPRSDRENMLLLIIRHWEISGPEKQRITQNLVTPAPPPSPELYLTMYTTHNQDAFSLAPFPSTFFKS